MRDATAKGLLFTYLHEWAVSHHSEEAWQRALAATSPETRELYEGLLLASSWQPISAWNEIVDAFFPAQYADADAGMRAFCQDLGERELTSLVKLVLKMGSPGFLLKRTGFLWNRYFGSGSFHARELGPQRWQLWLDAVADTNRAANRLTCANGPGPWLERGFELCGCPGTVKHTRCRFDGSPRCEWEATW